MRSLMIAQRPQKVSTLRGCSGRKLVEGIAFAEPAHTDENAPVVTELKQAN
jgi:hypothetical protein